MLHEIESVLIKYTRNVARRRKRDADIVRGIETDQGQIYKGNKSAQTTALKEAELAAKNLYL